ncbi:uncharacterized protein LOC62_04G006555 [Vanrija pseudolonga]|uniref:Uncharacterized protein n=1 Tax=Vanrija pseudolonga TaxID=143232 RepID=A0AAF0YBS7_9TREE|nr:hypothetical protein LOC62_04G006555 [Vanrija pseudolonga]
MSNNAAQYHSLRDENGFVLPDPFNLLIHLCEDSCNRRGPGVDKCVVSGCPSRRLYHILNMRMPYCSEHLDSIRLDPGGLVAALYFHEGDADTRALTHFVYDSVRRAQAFLAGEDYSWELFNRAAAAGPAGRPPTQPPTQN